MRSWLLGLIGIIFSLVIVFAVIYGQKASPPTGALSTGGSSQVNDSISATAVPIGTATSTPLITSTASPGPQPSSNTPNPTESSSQTPVDLTVDANSGLSKTSVIINTSAGVIKFKFYSQDAPKTVKRMVELINKGFYNGLTFHRVVPGFVIQGGDPSGNGTGGSGQKLEAEFNNRKHVEGAVAMARASDPNSADSQFYISLGTFPHLDHNYTIFGQVVEGMDIARKTKVGDKMNSVSLQ